MSGPEIVRQRIHRYFITPPVDGGYAWWDVCDSRSEVMPNFAVATFFKDLPGAEAAARALCDQLNHISRP